MMSFWETVKRLLGIRPVEVAELNRRATREVQKTSPEESPQRVAAGKCTHCGRWGWILHGDFGDGLCWSCASRRLDREGNAATRRTSERRSRKKARRFGAKDIFQNNKVSFTKIDTFNKCPRMFELIYLYGFEDKKGRAAQIGSLVHKIVQLYTGRHKDHLPDSLKHGGALGDLLSLYDEAVSSTDLTYSIPKSELRPYLSNFVVLNRTGNARIHKIEHECISKIGSYDLKCIIDRIDVGNRSTFTIIDYKTGNPQNALSHQLNVYAYALSQGKRTPCHLVFQFLKTGEIRDWKYTAQLHRAAEEWLLEGIEEVENTKVFHRNRSALCDYCGVSQHCYRVS